MKRILSLLILAVFMLQLGAVSIYDIQYTTNPGDGTYPSPMADQDVTIQGIVTGAGYAGEKFFVCDLPEEGTGAWHGIYVYNVDPEQAPSLGDIVEISGTVSEYYGVTELGYVTVSVLSSGNAVPGPTSVSTLDLVVPTFAEQYEGCFVAVSNVEVTEGQNDYGEWYIDDGTGECQVDDGFFYLDEIDPPIVVSPGDTFGTIKGILDYSYDLYGLNPRFPDDMMDSSNDVTEIQNGSYIIGNYPNPFNPETTISYNIDQSTNVKVDIYNIQGKKVKTLVNEMQNAGQHKEVWDGKDDNGKSVGSGMYFFKLRTSRYDGTKRMILMK